MEDRTKSSKADQPSAQSEDLPYLIEVRQGADADKVERVLARAASPQLAQAIFAAARNEHPGQRITLRKGTRIISDSAGST